MQTITTGLLAFVSPVRRDANGEATWPNRLTGDQPERWTTAPGFPLLCAAEVHVWRACLNVAPLVLARRLAVLDATERARTLTFRSERVRDRYIAARGLLREILARYVNTASDRIAFQCNAYGKPALSGAYAATDLRFNLSHSGAVALYAIAIDRDVGVDIEQVSTALSQEHIAEQFFSRFEVEALRALPPHVQQQAFFACWTRKEAFVKARGLGLSLPLSRFSVNLTPNQPARLLDADPPSELERWSMTAVSAGPGYEAALVVEGSDWRLKCRDWKEQAARDESKVSASNYSI